MLDRYRFHPISDKSRNRKRLKLVLSRLPESMTGVAFDTGVVNDFSLDIALEHNCLQVKNVPEHLDIDFNLMPFPSENMSVDYVFSFEVLEHLMNPLLYLRDCHRILKNGGTLYLTTPIGFFPSFLWWKHHFHEYDKRRLFDLLESAGFTVARCVKMRYWWKGGVFRPALKMIFGRTHFIEAEKTNG